MLGAAIDRGIWVAVRAAEAGHAVFGGNHGAAPITVTLNASLAKQSDERAWVNYQLGVWAKLPDFGLQQPAGFQCVDVSDLPPGAGLSSSAAIELATGLALTALAGDVDASVDADQAVTISLHKHRGLAA